MNGYNFTERVRKVLAMAREEAVRLHHEYVGTEHLLLGLIREGEGVAAAVLRNFSVDFDQVQQKIEERVKKGEAVTGPDLPFTSRAKQVLKLAMDEARDLGHGYVGTEHLLLGLIREGEGIAAQVLGDVGVNRDRTKTETLRLLKKSSSERVRDTLGKVRQKANEWVEAFLWVAGFWWALVSIVWLVSHIPTPILILIGFYAAYVGIGLVLLYVAVRVVRATWRT